MSFAGIADMLFQVFLFSSVSGSGLSSSVPLQVGSATLFGAFLTLLVDKRAKVGYFIPGVIINVIAVTLDTVTYGSLQKDNKAYEKEHSENVELTQQEEPRQRFSMKRILFVGLVGALFNIPFGPGMALAGKEPNSLSPYVPILNSTYIVIILAFGLIWSTYSPSLFIVYSCIWFSIV